MTVSLDRARSEDSRRYWSSGKSHSRFSNAFQTPSNAAPNLKWSSESLITGAAP